MLGCHIWPNVWLLWGKASGDTFFKFEDKATLGIRLDRFGGDRGQLCSGQSCLELFGDRLLNLKGEKRYVTPR